MVPGRAAVRGLIVLTTVVAAGSAALVLLSADVDLGGPFWVIVFALLHFALIAPLVNVLHRPAFRAGGLFLACTFLASWGMTNLCATGQIESGRWVNTFLSLLATGIPAGVGLMFRRKAWGGPFAWSAATVAVVSGAMLLVAIWFPSLMMGSESKLATGALYLLVYGTIGAMLLVNVGRGDRRYFRWPALAAAAVALVLAGLGVNQEEQGKSELILSYLAAGLAGTFALVNVLLMTRRRGAVGVFKWAAIAAVSAAGALWVARIGIEYATTIDAWTVGEPIDTWLARGLIAATFLAIGAVICQLAARTELRIVPAPAEASGVAAAVKTVNVECPNCHAPGLVSVAGGGRCNRCLLGFRVTVIEPHCRGCGYLLINSAGENCPECGRVIEGRAVETLKHS